MGRFPLGAEFLFFGETVEFLLGWYSERGGGGAPQEKDWDSRRLAFIGVKNCRSRPHLGCAGLKARLTPAVSQGF